ncbi:MAG: nucleotide-binding protein [Desulfurococcaceae archaeon]
MTEHAIILDTGALLAKYYRLIPRFRVKLFTTPSAVEEVKDIENKEALIQAIELELITIESPAKKYVEKVVKLARNIGEITRLSNTDIEIAALALMLNDKEYKAIVITDDYDLQNLLLHVGIGFKPLKTRGIEGARVYIEHCPTCGYVPGSPGERTCPLCNTPLKRIMA